MSLPKPVQPVFTLHIEETAKTYKYRPFVMKEERAILQARILGDDGAVRDTIENVVQACIHDKTNKIDVAELPAHIVDYIFIQMFTKSSTDRLPVTYTCVNEITYEKEFEEMDENGKEFKETREVTENCNHQSRNHLDLKQVTIHYPENYKEKKSIKVDDKITLNIDYPKSRSMREFYKAHEVNEYGEYVLSEKEREEANLQLMFESIVNITTVNDDESVTVAKPEIDFTSEEFVEWLDELPKDISVKMIAFYQDLPVIKMTSKMQCLNTKCLHSTEYDFIGVRAFLDLS